MLKAVTLYLRCQVMLSVGSGSQSRLCEAPSVSYVPPRCLISENITCDSESCSLFWFASFCLIPLVCNISNRERKRRKMKKSENVERCTPKSWRQQNRNLSSHNTGPQQKRKLHAHNVCTLLARVGHRAHEPR